MANSKGSNLKLLSYEDRALTLDDTQGMFLLLGAGFLIGASVLVSEIFGGCFNICKTKRSQTTSASTLQSNGNKFSLNNSRVPSSVLSQYEKIDSSNILESHFGDIVHNYSNEIDVRKLKLASEKLIMEEMKGCHRRSKSSHDIILN
ncbi:hypothetical protein GWI33_001023 [Rhynchophorus ferrugineus]|uniref:Uncharacterized protein n=1 Tax=Rhynchophorus ferrugineus TaxID=354439 RepID=A0A834LXI5_RHYFE|nr:hypothetical protein GWI33_001023 [Rhynchophorus ferrugineus]